MIEKKSHGRSRAGVELTDEVLEQMAQEAEAGLDATKLRRRPGRPAMGSGPAETVPVRLDPELRRALEDRAAAEDAAVSDVVRQALRRHLNQAPRDVTTQRAQGANEPLTEATFEVYKDKGGAYRWRLQVNSNVIADSSEGYATKTSCLHAVEVVRRALVSAAISDLTDSRK